MPTNSTLFPPSWIGSVPSLDTFASISAIEALSLYNNQVAKKTKKAATEKDDMSNPVSPLKGFKFGCDPEGFLFKNGKPVPAGDYLPGNKYEPHKVDKGAIQVDGLAAEFNIDPVSTHADWEENISAVIQQLKDMLPKDVELRWVPTVTFDEATFDKAKEEDKVLGCLPDYDAWEGAPNPPPSFSEHPTMRCAGGHIHFGWTEGEDLCDEQHVMNCRDLVQQLDWYVGGWSLNHDSDTFRRNLYGKMGSCRLKDYGVEYRTVSNFWVATPKLRRQVWDRMCTAVNNVSRLFIPDRAGSSLTQLLRNAINSTGQLDEQLRHLCAYPLETLAERYCRI